MTEDDFNRLQFMCRKTEDMTHRRLLHREMRQRGRTPSKEERRVNDALHSIRNEIAEFGLSIDIHDNADNIEPKWFDLIMRLRDEADLNLFGIIEKDPHEQR